MKKNNFFTKYISVMNSFHKKITLITLIFTFILRGGIMAQESMKMSLEEAIKYAFAHSTSIKNAQVSITDADLRIKESLAGGLPKVDAEVNLQHFLIQPGLPSSALGFGNIGAAFTPIIDKINEVAPKVNVATIPVAQPTDDSDQKVKFQLKNNFNGGVTVSQLVFSGSYTVAKRAARFYKELVNVQLTKEEEKLRNAVMDAYLPTLLLDESVKTLDKNIVNLEKLFKEVSATYKAGLVEQLDVDRLEFSINNLKAQRDNLVRQRQAPLNALKMVMSYPIDQDLELSDDINTLLKPLSDAELNEAINYQKRAEIRELDASMKLVELNVELNKAANLPTIAAFGSFQYALQGNSLNKLFGIPSSLIGITARYNIWDNNEKKIKTQRAALEVEKLRNAKGDLERAINLQASLARIAITTAQKNLESQQKNLTLAEKIFNITQKKYKEGVGSSIELITAERDIYTAQQTVRQAQYDVLKAQMDWQKAIGR
jgi:outer membrane protein